MRSHHHDVPGTYETYGTSRTHDANDTRPSALLVRPRLDGDLEACAETLAAVHAHSAYPRNWPADPAGWLSPAALDTAWVAVATDRPAAAEADNATDGAVLGHVCLCRATPDDRAVQLWSAEARTTASEAAVVSRLFVAPAARGCGVGTQLLAAAVHAARASGRQAVLDVLESDTAARALYERLGWRLLATAEQEWEPGQVVTLHCYVGP